MNVQQLINSPDLGKISLVVGPKDLSQFAKQVAEQTAQSLLKDFENKEPQEQETEKLLTADEVCKRLNISRVTLHKWGKKGWINPVKLGYAVRWRETDVKAIQKGGVKP